MNQTFFSCDRSPIHENRLGGRNKRKYVNDAHSQYVFRRHLNDQARKHVETGHGPRGETNGGEFWETSLSSFSMKVTTRFQNLDRYLSKSTSKIESNTALALMQRRSTVPDELETEMENDKISTTTQQTSAPSVTSKIGTQLRVRKRRSLSKPDDLCLMPGVAWSDWKNGTNIKQERRKPACQS